MTLTITLIIVAALIVIHCLYGYYGNSILADKINTILEIKSFDHPDFTLGLHYTSQYEVGPWKVHKFIVGAFFLNLAFEFFRREEVIEQVDETENEQDECPVIKKVA